MLLVFAMVVLFWWKKREAMLLLADLVASDMDNVGYLLSTITQL
jgi:hypothetical protein